MNKRIANVKKASLNSLSYSSIFEIGDARTFTPKAFAIAVQKQGGVRTDEGFDFDRYEIFDRKIIETPFQQIPIQKKTVHHDSTIYVNNIDITGVSASSMVQIGSLQTIDAEARIKHIRVLKQEQF
ncbi:spore germination protein GerPE [Aquibacillus rhizosphaerae]|uniref:Spore germination protein GerPE n=1 Tax=Aquibacillus rhizosphaerae TaxID=3051431 RepID=A0ABT7LAI9_9BACI|nr:spore germination protein GerPE [Aquibacillus sp. LR5S19]MDL4842867.1 spore germination protein GerPE [Aquibacillus sp. LR5S19]